MTAQVPGVPQDRLSPVGCPEGRSVQVWGPGRLCPCTWGEPHTIQPGQRAWLCWGQGPSRCLVLGPRSPGSLQPSHCLSSRGACGFGHPQPLRVSPARPFGLSAGSRAVSCLWASVYSAVCTPFAVGSLLPEQCLQHTDLSSAPQKRAQRGAEWIDEGQIPADGPGTVQSKMGSSVKGSCDFLPSWEEQ